MKTPWEKLDKGATMAEMWDGFLKATIPPTAPQVQKDEMRNAFYAGGLCFFNWMMVQMDPGEEPTDADEKRMEAMSAELHGYFEDFLKRHGLG